MEINEYKMLLNENNKRLAEILDHMRQSPATANAARIIDIIYQDILVLQKELYYKEDQ